VSKHFFHYDVFVEVFTSVEWPQTLKGYWHPRTLAIVADYSRCILRNDYEKELEVRGIAGQDILKIVSHMCCTRPSPGTRLRCIATWPPSTRSTSSVRIPHWIMTVNAKKHSLVEMSFVKPTTIRFQYAIRWPNAREDRDMYSL
jgi:hypothetical protein